MTVGGPHAATTFLTNNSSIDLNAAALVLYDLVSLEGNGKVTLSDNPSNSISGGLFDSSNTISGAGTITFDRMINDVGGIIDATGVNPLYVSNVEGADWIRNLGTLESTNPNHFSAVGGLEIDSTTIYNYGIIEANGPNTHVRLYHCYIVGGTLETRGANAVIYITGDGSAWDGTQPGDPVNIFGHVQFSGQTSLGLTGTINNEGTISLENSNGVGDCILVNSDVTLKGGGHITLTNSPVVGEQDGIFGTGVLTNVDNVISGCGVIGNYSGFSGSGTILINEVAGTIDANQSTPLILEDRSFINAGLMEATQHGTLLIDGAVIENFLDATNGTISVQSGSTLVLGGTIEGGTLIIHHGGTFDVPGNFPDLSEAGNLENVTVLGGLTLNSGFLRLSGTTTIENAKGTGPGAITLNGSGTFLAVSGTLYNKINLHGGYITDGAVTIGKGGLVQGYGGFYEGQVAATSVHNEGTINADVNGQTLYMGQSAGGLSFTNDGLLLASRGGIISVNYNDPDVDPWSNNADGKISAMDRGTLQLGGDFTNYGLISGVNSTIYLGDAKFGGTQNAGDIVVKGGKLFLGGQGTNRQWMDSGSDRDRWCCN